MCNQHGFCIIFYQPWRVEGCDGPGPARHGTDVWTTEFSDCLSGKVISRKAPLHNVCCLSDVCTYVYWLSAPKLYASVIGWSASHEFQLTNHRQRTALVADTVHTTLTNKILCSRCKTLHNLRKGSFAALADNVNKDNVGQCRVMCQSAMLLLWPLPGRNGAPQYRKYINKFKIQKICRQKYAKYGVEG